MKLKLAGKKIYRTNSIETVKIKLIKRILRTFEWFV